MIPGYLVQGEGYLTLAITSLFWGTAGFAIGYAKDRRVAADDENKVTEELKKEGFGVLTEIDPVASMQSVKNESLGEIATKIQSKLKQVIDNM